MHSYFFKFQNTTSSKYLVYALLALIVCVAITFMLHVDSVLVFMLSIFAPLLIGFYFFIKYGKASDTIVVDDLGFTSAYYGRVNYHDIVDIPPFGLFGAPPPSLKIRLKSTRKIAWQLNFADNIFNKEEDALRFKEFTEELERRLATHHGFAKKERNLKMLSK